MNPNPNPNPPSLEQYYASSHYSHYPNLQTPTTRSSLQPSLHALYSEPTTLRPPGVESYPSLSSYPQGHAAAGYYVDPNSLNSATKEVVQQYGSAPPGYGGAVGVTMPPNGAEQLAIALQASTVWANLTFQPPGNNAWKKQQKKTKVVQSAYCEVCKLDCNSKEVLSQHKLGKKHKKNLEKLQAAAATAFAPITSVASSIPIIGPRENINVGKTGEGQRSKKKAAGSVEDLETKRRKILDGGAAVEAVRACALCNVVCNSEKVFNYHLAGQKHATMLKKHAAGLGLTTAT